MDNIIYKYDGDGNLDLTNSYYCREEGYMNEALAMEMINHLNSVEKRVVYEIYYNGKDEKEIAMENEMTLGAIVRIHKNALNKMNSVYRYENSDDNVRDISSSSSLWELNDSGEFEKGTRKK